MRALSLFALLLLPAALPAATYHLEADGSGDLPTIAAALAVATAGDVIELGCGTYYEHDLEIAAGVTLRSETGLADCATIDAQEQGRVLQGSPELLQGLTICNGYVDELPYSGGGAALSGSPQVLNCDFVHNRIAPQFEEAHGGALTARGAQIELVHCRFSGNSGGESGTIALDAPATLIGCSLHGEGVDVEGSNCELCLISGCTFLGSNVRVFDAALRVNGTLAVGVGIELYSGCDQLELSNSSFIRAGIANWGGPISLFMQYCLLDEGELFPWGCQDIEAAFMACNDLHGGSAPAVIADQVGQQGNFAADPLFCDAPGGDYRLHANSPCAPAGNECGTLIGALPVGCDATALESRSWGSIKALY